MTTTKVPNEVSRHYRIALLPWEWNSLTEKAGKRGLKVDAYVQELILKDLHPEG